MHLRILPAGKLRDPAAGALCAAFEKRLGDYHRLDIPEVRDSRGSEDDKAIADPGARY